MKSTRKGCLPFLVIPLLLIALAVGAFYAFRPQIIAFAQSKLDEELSANDLFLDYQLEIGANWGITLSEITAYQTSARKDPLLTLDKAFVRIPFGALFQDRSVLAFVWTRKGTLTAYRGAGDSTETVTLEDLQMRLEAGSETHRLTEFKTALHGVTYDVQATIHMPQEDGVSEAASNHSSPSLPGLIIPVAGESADAPPLRKTSLDVSGLFSLAETLDYREAGFPARLAIQTEGTLQSDGSSSWELAADTASFPSQGKDLHLEGPLRILADGTIQFPELTLTDETGKASATGRLPADEDTLVLDHLDSNLDWVAILK
ncbi:MAG: hypothetical protein AAF191_06315, partial [Verrucomicrobiota bacterium]